MARWVFAAKQPTHCPNHGHLRDGLSRMVEAGQSKNVSSSSSYRAEQTPLIHVKAECFNLNSPRMVLLAGGFLPGILRAANRSWFLCTGCRLLYLNFTFSICQQVGILECRAFNVHVWFWIRWSGLSIWRSNRLGGVVSVPNIFLLMPSTSYEFHYYGLFSINSFHGLLLQISRSIPTLYTTMRIKCIKRNSTRPSVKAAKATRRGVRQVAQQGCLEALRLLVRLGDEAVAKVRAAKFRYSCLCKRTLESEWQVWRSFPFGCNIKV